ncbi:MAG: hypothetical protein V3V74_07800 [Nitrosomonadaceae bacterium]
MKLKNAIEHAWALKTIESFMDEAPKNENEKVMYSILIEMVKEYEDEHCKIPKPTPEEAAQFRAENE